MAKKQKRIEVGWAMMRLNKAGNWKREFFKTTRTDAVSWYGFRDYDRGRRAGTLKVKKAYVTM